MAPTTSTNVHLNTSDEPFAPTLQSFSNEQGTHTTVWLRMTSFPVAYDFAISRDQIQTLRDVLSAWLEANPAPAAPVEDQATYASLTRDGDFGGESIPDDERPF